MEWKKPTICLIYEEKNEAIATEIMAGIEEEGLFYERCHSIQSTPFQMALEACTMSQLGLGIGIVDNHVVVHCEKLKGFQPLFDVRSRESKVLRCIGTNVARYIKGIPLKKEYTV